MSSNTESFIWSNISATPAAVTALGGLYALTIHTTTWNAATISLKALAADGITWVIVDNIVQAATAFSADGNQQFNLPPGQYQLAITGAPTGVYASLARIPT